MGFLHERRGASKTDDNVGTLATKIGNENWTLANLTEVYHQRMASYIPKPVAARLLCIVSESNARSAEFSAQEWRNFAPHSEVAIVPGNHFTCITTHAGALTNHLRERLAALDT
jgi:thioesterase domain-containing protein